MSQFLHVALFLWHLSSCELFNESTSALHCFRGRRSALGGAQKQRRLSAWAYRIYIYISDNSIQISLLAISKAVEPRQVPFFNTLSNCVWRRQCCRSLAQTCNPQVSWTEASILFIDIYVISMHYDILCSALGPCLAVFWWSLEKVLENCFDGFDSTLKFNSDPCYLKTSLERKGFWSIETNLEFGNVERQPSTDDVKHKT